MPNASPPAAAQIAAPTPQAQPTIRFHKLVLERGDSGPRLTPMGTPVALLDPVTKRPRNATLYAFISSYLCGRNPAVATSERVAYPEAVLVKPFVELPNATYPLEFWPAGATVVVDGAPEAIARAFPGGPTRDASPAPASTVAPPPAKKRR